MTWITPKLSERVQLGTPGQTPNADGGFDFTFNSIVTLWMDFEPITFKGSASQYVRGEQTKEGDTHTFKVREIELSSLGLAFTSAFSTGFDSIADLNAIKTQNFLFVEKGSSSKGRLFRITGTTNNKEQDEYININAQEIEERGTGWPE